MVCHVNLSRRSQVVRGDIPVNMLSLSTMRSLLLLITLSLGLFGCDSNDVEEDILLLRIDGSVRSVSGGVAIEAATVIIGLSGTLSNETAFDSVYTDAQGRYELASTLSQADTATSCDLWLLARADGYVEAVPVTDNLILCSEDRQEFDFILEPKN